MKRGDVIELRAYGGEVITRRLVQETGAPYFACREDEYEASVREAREPGTFVFPKGDRVYDR